LQDLILIPDQLTSQLGPPDPLRIRSILGRPQQLSPDTTWAEPSIVKPKLAKGSPGLSTSLPDKRVSTTDDPVEYVYWCMSHQQYVEPSAGGHYVTGCAARSGNHAIHRKRWTTDSNF